MISNLTNKECLRLNGSLPIDRIEELLTLDAQLQAVKGVDAHIEEAMCQFPAEDFLSEVIVEFQQFAKRLRGGNKEDLLFITNKLDDIAQCQFNAADYGRDELRKALKAVRGDAK